MARRRLPIVAMDLPALTEPRVSIVVCNYNYARFLDAALGSAVDQSYPCEVVAVDDGSTDESREMLERWSPRVKVILQENAGQAAAYNSGFNASTGDIVIFLDSDDVLDQHAVGLVLHEFAAGVAKVHFRLRLVDGGNRPLGGSIPNVLASGNVVDRLTRRGILYPSTPGSGNAYRRSVLARMMPLPVDARDRHGADFFTVYGSGLFGEVRASSAILGSYRVHETSSGDSPATTLVFGNAAQGTDEVERFRRRAKRFREWVSSFSGGEIQLPERLVDFSVEKVAFARAVFEARGYFAGLEKGRRELGTLLRALWFRAEFSISRKLGLSAWAIAVLVAPRRFGFPLARYVCNPASRS